jgi:hypothetical protein
MTKPKHKGELVEVCDTHGRCSLKLDVAKHHEKESEWEFFSLQELLDEDKFNRRPRHSLRYTPTAIEVPMANGNIIKIPVTSDIDIDISEEMNRCGVWKDLEENND